MACQPDHASNSQKGGLAPDPGELLQQWDNACNRNDLEALHAMIAENVVFLLHGERRTPEILYQFLGDNIAVIKNLYTESAASNVSEDIIYQSGTYSHGILSSDSLRFRGTFTFIWERQANEGWKMKIIDISEQKYLDDEGVAPLDVHYEERPR
jgi:ketosteroid isomerase-like protein